MLSDLNRYANHRRTIALTLSICFAIFCLFSAAIVFANADHIHNHDNIDNVCTACNQLGNAVNTLKQLGTALVGCFAIYSGLYSAIIEKSMPSIVLIPTLVASKIRMNN